VNDVGRIAGASNPHCNHEVESSARNNVPYKKCRVRDFDPPKLPSCEHICPSPNNLRYMIGLCGRNVIIILSLKKAVVIIREEKIRFLVPSPIYYLPDKAQGHVHRFSSHYLLSTASPTNFTGCASCRIPRMVSFK
jgi:hypothetical protein